ncbi:MULTISPECIES: helix-turn-helix domain-containing protein [Bacillaceae]|uniref:helix-turn-helix domain-containing protein n=1 Tax=Bacillaceae TaxID=186817 RepID=UPI00118C07AC|nr:helix-turn-helix transcriptional regulator [Bacillus sp. S3]QCJ43905.1 helix-turn-helix transcriptional regulator [Bacillus sp. S3]
MLGTKIQKLRQERNLTLSQLAEKTDISKSYLSHIERNIQTNPSIEVLVKIAAALEVNIQTLLSPNNSTLETRNPQKNPLIDWSVFINTALESGLINEADLREIKLAIQNSKPKT